MKKLLIFFALTCWFFICTSATLPKYPMTNVMQLTVSQTLYNQNKAEIEAGINRLKESYDDDHLIVLLNILNDAGTSFELSFNGKVLLKKYHEIIKHGQPVWGEMEFARISSAKMYLDNITYSANIALTLKDATDGENHTNLTVQYLVINEATNVILYKAEQDISVSTDGTEQNISHTVSAELDASVNKKAVVIVKDEGTGEVMQAASSTRVLHPFRVVAGKGLSVISDEEMFHATADDELFYFVNTNPVGTNPVELYLEITDEINDFGLDFDFCDEKLCYSDRWTEITLNPNSISSYFNYSVYNWSAESGSVKLRFSALSSGYKVEFPIYFSTPDVDLLVIQDDAGGNNDVFLSQILKTGDFTYGIYNPSFGKLDVENIQNISCYLWNVPALIPALSSEVLDTIVTNRKIMVVIGQFIANTLSDEALSSYATSGTKDFLRDVMFAEVVNSDRLITEITSEDGTLSFGLINDGSRKSVMSKNSIKALGSHTTLFNADGGIIKAVTGNFGNGNWTSLLDFNLQSVEHTKIAAVMNTFLSPQGMDIDPNVDLDPTLSGNEKNDSLPKVSKINIFPNPAKNVINIFLNTGSFRSVREADYELFNIRGQKVLTGKLASDNGGLSSKIDIRKNRLSSGIYFIKVNSDIEQKVSKMIILK